MNKPAKAETKKRPTLGWVISAFIGSAIAWGSSSVILPLVFGMSDKSSSSLWMFSGMPDLVMGLKCLPAFLLAHGISYAALENTDTTQWRAYRSAFQGIFFFWIVLIIAWAGDGPVLRAR